MASKIHTPRKPRPKSRAEFFTREEEAWNELTAAWQGLPEGALSQSGACGPTWSVKDVMNHVAAWQEAALRVIPELMQGRKATAGHGTDRFNAIHYEQDADRSLAETLEHLHATRRRFLELVETLPDEVILDIDSLVGRWIKYSCYAHYHEHIYNLNVFRESLKK